MFGCISLDDLAGAGEDIETLVRIRLAEPLKQFKRDLALAKFGIGRAAFDQCNDLVPRFPVVEAFPVPVQQDDTTSRRPHVVSLVRVPLAVLLKPFQRGLASAEIRIDRSEEHTSELQSLLRISYAVFCLKKPSATRIYPSRHTLSLTDVRPFFKRDLALAKFGIVRAAFDQCNDLVPRFPVVEAFPVPVQQDDTTSRRPHVVSLVRVPLAVLLKPFQRGLASAEFRIDGAALDQRGDLVM